MKRIYLLPVVLAVVAAAGCSDTTEPSLLSDAQVTADIAVSSGDAIVTEVGNLLGNEAFGGLAGAPAGLVTSPPVGTRSRTCYDASDVAQAQCDPQTTSWMHIAVSFDGARSGDHFSSAMHWTRDMVISGLLGTETSRTHDGVGTSLDSLSFTGDRGSRASVESAVDSIRAIVFNLPHATNPWPVSGSIVRRVSGMVTATVNGSEQSRSYNRRVEVTFPADAQGNVVIQVGDRTCTLNLVTRTVTGCS